MSDKRGSKGLTAEQVIEALRDTNGNTCGRVQVND